MAGRRVIILVEGKTERALKEALHRTLDPRCKDAGVARPGIETRRWDSFRDPKKVQTQVHRFLDTEGVLCVVGLVDVRPYFPSPDEAKLFLRKAAGSTSRFHPHVAHHDFEAWLLPYWDDICRRLGVQRRRPGANPEEVNDQKPPSQHLEELYRLARRSYQKPQDAHTILADQDLALAARECPELKALLNTLLHCCGLEPVP